VVNVAVLGRKQGSAIRWVWGGFAYGFGRDRSGWRGVCENMGEEKEG